MKLILDESDSYGVEMALQLVDTAGGGEVTLVSMAPNNEVGGLRTALAMGAAKAVLVSDDALAGSDALGTAKVLAKAIERAGDGRPGDHRHRVLRRLHGHRARADRRAPRSAVDHLRQVDRGRRRHREGAAPDRGRLRRRRVPHASARIGDRRCGRAPLPVLQGHHGRQVQAGRRGDGIADLGIDAAQVGWAGAGQEIVEIAEAEAREAGTIIEDDGEGFQKIVDFLAELKVI